MKVLVITERLRGNSVVPSSIDVPNEWGLGGAVRAAVTDVGEWNRDNHELARRLVRVEILGPSTYAADGHVTFGDAPPDGPRVWERGRILLEGAMT